MNRTYIIEPANGIVADANAASPARLLLQAMLDIGVILLEEWHSLDEGARQTFLQTTTAEQLLPLLGEAGLLTDYQAARVLAGGMSHLVFGNYRILDRIGSGGMGVVYRGEHVLMRRPVALKVLQIPPDQGDIVLKRFFAEMRVLARIQHPNIVGALDAGTRLAGVHETHDFHYLVMEYIVGANLEQMVEKAPLSVAHASDLIYQMASALDETHRHELIHRDIKPSNILETPDGVGKLLDFGLALHFGRRRLTNPGTLLGTLSYMAPEQIADSAGVDIRADIYGLGATLYYSLAGEPPFQSQGPWTQQVAARLSAPPPDVRALRSDVPIELEAVIRRMMAHQREDRYATPQSVLRALLPFVNPVVNFGSPRHKSEPSIVLPDLDGETAVAPAAPRILIVDDDARVRSVCKSYFRSEGFECHEAGDGADGMQRIGERPFDLVLLDIDMPRLTGPQLLRWLREEPPCNHLKVIMMSGGVSPDELAEMLALGADDYLVKPLGRQQLLARVKAALVHKATQDRSETLNQQLLGLNAELEKTLAIRQGDLVQARNALVFALAKIVESRSQETSAHLTRMAEYAGALARRARSCARLARVLEEPFLKTLESCTLLHDIGNVALPDHVLRPTGPLDPEDIMILQAHTTIGSDTLKSVAKRDRNAAAFWQMAMDIARHHHERFDGAGYPDRLCGNDIPLSARIVAIADAYDALRCPNALGIALSHNAAVEMIVEGSRGRFDPLLVQAFQQGHSAWEEIFHAYPETDTALLAPLMGDQRRAPGMAGITETPGSYRLGRQATPERRSRPNPTGNVGSMEMQ
jgi:response regulator RpfG family c-di-GMP phosphodiesterase/serine/threonine protein kinase